MLMSLLKNSTIAIVANTMLAILAISLDPKLFNSLLFSYSYIGLLCSGIIIVL
jgi:hypothetical protein